MDLYKISDRVGRYLCINTKESTYRAVWIDIESVNFRLESLIDPSTFWIPIPEDDYGKILKIYKLVEEGLTLREVYEHLSMLQLMEA